MAMLKRAISTSQVDVGRRSFLRTSAMAAAVVSAPSLITSCTKPGNLPVSRKPRVAVVGAGIAGLHAAHLLNKQGIDVQVYEASTRTGGRIFTVNNVLAPNAVTELGGEYIDTIHADMMNLINEFNLELLDLGSEPFVHLKQKYVFNGMEYTDADVVREIKPILEVVSRDLASIPNDLSKLADSPAQRFDAMSLEAYFTQLGVTGWLRAFLESAFTTENGQEPAEQSALNFLTAVGDDLSDGTFHQYGVSDERYKVKGGNQLVTDRLAGTLGARIHHSHFLERITKVGTQFVLSFRKDVTSVEIQADYVILALPFTTLRSVDIAVELPPKKRALINELRYGANAKICIGYDIPFWGAGGYNGMAYTDEPLQLTWDNMALQNANGAGLTVFSGGANCRALGSMGKTEAERTVLKALPELWSTATNYKPYKIVHMHWPTHKYTLGGYSSYGTGQWTTFFGEAIKNVGNLFFAGEHCSEEFRGYMNGGAVTGRYAAEKILARIAATTF